MKQKIFGWGLAISLISLVINLIFLDVIQIFACSVLALVAGVGYLGAKKERS